MTKRRGIYRIDANGCARADDELAHEEPLEIRVRGRSVAITMRTPGLATTETDEDAELAAGFLLAESIVRCADDIVRIEPCARPQGENIVNVYLAPKVKFDPDQLSRHVFTSSSCGVCGKASIEALHHSFPPVTSDAHIQPDVLRALPDKLREAQARFNRTGGLHAAGLFDTAGNLIAAREDVGRHNAVDKVLGHALLNRMLPLSQHVLLVSGRTSFEIIQKALSAGVPIVAAVSAPSSLAVDLAESHGMTLIGFLREQRMNIYCNASRVIG